METELELDLDDQTGQTLSCEMYLSFFIFCLQRP